MMNQCENKVKPTIPHEILEIVPFDSKRQISNVHPALLPRFLGSFRCGVFTVHGFASRVERFTITVVSSFTARISRISRVAVSVGTVSTRRGRGVGRVGVRSTNWGTGTTGRARAGTGTFSVVMRTTRGTTGSRTLTSSRLGLYN